MILVDTGVWSLALRRNRLHLNDEQKVIRESLLELIERGRAQLLGQIRQELLSGIREEAQFLRVRDKLHAFPDVALHEIDFEEAARASNKCRTAGISGANVDFLLCAAAIQRQWAVFSTDKDFERYAKILPIKLYKPAA